MSALTPDRLEDDLAAPRCRHYTLAHRALRDIAFSDPLGFLGLFASDRARDFLANLLDDITEHCREQEPNPDFGVDDLVIHTTRIGQFPCAILEMPTPRACPEAYFVAAVLLIELGQDSPEPAEYPLRYITLEKGPSLGGPSIPVLCEWTRDGTHSNFGGGPPAELKLFAEAVADLLKPE